jgi:hypothetical protein
MNNLENLLATEQALLCLAWKSDEEGKSDEADKLYLRVVQQRQWLRTVKEQTVRDCQTRLVLVR